MRASRPRSQGFSEVANNKYTASGLKMAVDLRGFLAQAKEAGFAHS